MPIEWYYQSMGAELGPFAPSQMRELASRGIIQPDTRVRRGNNNQWLDASQVKGLFAGQQKAPASSDSQKQRPQPLPPGVPPKLAITPNVKNRSRVSRHVFAGSALGAVALAAAATGFALFMSRLPAPEVATKQEPPAAPVRPRSVLQSLFSARTLTTEEVVARSEAAIALITTSNGSGTGFLVQPKTIATNKHVIAHSHPSIKIQFPSADEAHRGPMPARLVYVDPSRDLAFLQVDTDLPPLTVAQQYDFRRGEEIVVIGNPGVARELVLQNAVSKGVMSTDATIDGQPYYQLGVAINPGNSGGPVFNMAGEVIGVVTLKASQKEGLAFCIPLSQLQQSMREMKDATARPVAVAAHKPVTFDIAGLRVGDRRPERLRHDWEEIRLKDGAEVTVFYQFEGGKLIGLHLSFEPSLFMTVVRAYSEKFGVPPHKTWTEEYLTKGGLRFENEIATWQTDAGEFTVEQYSYDINHGSATLMTPHLVEKYKKEIDATKDELKGKL